MPFCTRCGASIEGTFCTQCGPPANQAAPAAAPMRRTSPWVWVLVILLCFVGLGVMAVVGASAFVLHHARRAGVDAELFRTNPGLAIGRIVASTHPGLEVLDNGQDSGTVILRDRHTGKRFTMSFDDARRGRLSLRADDSEGHSGSVDIGDSASLPSWIPRYPGSNPSPVFSARGESDGDAGEAGDFTFETDDSPSRVLRFYEDRARELGMTLNTVRVGDTVTLAVTDDGHNRFLKVMAVASDGRTKVNVTYGRKR